ncbi:MAG TPA: lytic transglycosylase domain-containing protein [Bacillota bacterium]
MRLRGGVGRDGWRGGRDGRRRERRDGRHDGRRGVRRGGRGPGRLLARLAVRVLLVAAVGVLLLRWAYPLPYRDVVVTHADSRGLDAALVAAVIRVESGFNPMAVSPRGARGLMQVMPATGEWVATQLGMTGFEPGDLHDVDTNIAIGTWYLADLLRTFDDDLVLALAAYNGGRGNVSRWIQDRPGASLRDGSLDQRLAEIPFPETRRFVRRVLDGYRFYQLLYPSL